MRHPNAKKKKAIIIILNLYSIPYIRVNSKGITNLNVKDETIKNFTGTIRENIFEIVLGKDFLNVKLKSWYKTKLINWTTSKFLNFLIDTINIKRQATDDGKYFQIIYIL